MFLPCQHGIGGVTELVKGQAGSGPGLGSFFSKGRRVSTSGSAGHAVRVTTTVIHPCSAKAPTDNTEGSGQGASPPAMLHIRSHAPPLSDSRPRPASRSVCGPSAHSCPAHWEGG